MVFDFPEDAYAKPFSVRIHAHIRITDPDFKTPVAIDLALMNVFSIPSIGFYLVLINGPLWWGWSIGATLLVFLGLRLLALGLIRALKLWGSPNSG